MAVLPKKKGLDYDYGSTVSQIKKLEEERKKQDKRLADASKTRFDGNVMSTKPEEPQWLKDATMNAFRTNSGTVAENARRLGVANPLVAQPTMAAATSVQTPTAATATTTPPVERVSPAVNELLAMLRSKIDRAPVTSDEIMNSEAYKAQKAAADLNLATAQSGLRRSFASRNMLRSTPMIQAAENAEAEGVTRFNAEVIPQLIAAQDRRNQQELNNWSNYLGTLSGEEQQGFNRGVIEAGLTGQYGAGYTMQGRRNEADLTGIDPTTGKPIPSEERAMAQEARTAELQKLTVAKQTMENAITERSRGATGWLAWDLARPFTVPGAGTGNFGC